MSELTLNQAQREAIQFIESFKMTDCTDKAEYARFVDHRAKYRKDGKLPSIKTIEQVMSKRGYQVIFKKIKKNLHG